MARENFVGTLAPVAPRISRKRTRTMSDQMRSMQASAKLDQIGTVNAASKDDQTVDKQNRIWQREAWLYYDTVGELRYSARFVAACLSRCRLTLGIEGSDGKVGPVFDEDGNAIKGEDDKVLPGLEYAAEAQSILKSLKNPVGGQPQMLGNMGLNLAIAGEFHLVGSLPPGVEPTPETLADVTKLQWEILSTQEFYQEGSKYFRKRATGITPIEVDPATVHVVRCWRNHPQYSDQPDGMVRAVLEILEELVLLTRGVRGEVLSRLANGNLLLMPEEIEYPSDDNDDGQSDQGDPFTRDLLRAAASAVSDKASPAGVVPFVITAPAALLEQIRNIDLSPKNSDDTAKKRAEAVQRFAQGIDLPVEIVLGHAGTTFANAVQIDDSLFKSHIEPLLEIIAESLTVGFFTPALLSLGIKDSPLVVTYDSTELVARPNRSADAVLAWDRNVLSNASLRSAMGFADSDAPTDQEMEERIRIKQLTLVRQTIPTTPSGLQNEDKGIGTQSGQPVGAVTPPTAPGAPIQQGPLDGNNTSGSLTAAIVLSMAEIAVEQAVERAGGRLRSTANTRKPGLRQQLKSLSAADVTAAIGPKIVEELGETPESLLAGQFEVLHKLAMRTTGSRIYADRLRATCMIIAGERLYSPKAKFPYSRLPTAPETKLNLEPKQLTNA